MKPLHPDRTNINRILGHAELATLDNPGGLFQQLAYLIEDHEEFRKALNACDSGERRSMYEALRPHLRFQAHPLDVYLMQSADLAERKQLPVIAPDGTLREYRAPEINTSEVRTAVSEALGKQHLWLVCRKCTREATFSGMDKAECIQQARNAGWTYGMDTEGKGREICPTCPGGKAN